MAEDVVFLSEGQPPLRGRDAFESVSRSMAGKMRFEGHPDIREIHVAGDYAFCWTRLHVTATPRDEGLPIRRAGDVFSVFRKEQDGRWRLFRMPTCLRGCKRGAHRLSGKNVARMKNQGAASQTEVPEIMTTIPPMLRWFLVVLLLASSNGLAERSVPKRSDR